MNKNILLKSRAEKTEARKATLNRWASETTDWYLLNSIKWALNGLKDKRTHKTTYQEQKHNITAMRDRSKEKAKNKGRKWSENEIKMMMESDLKDEEIGAILGRSMQAVGQKRYIMSRKNGIPES